jgi:NhaP-type Na+/H+ or K+/H+ antiporter
MDAHHSVFSNSAYLGVFLFGYRYHWNFLHTFLAILACCVSRAVMIPLLSLVANWVAKIQRAAWYKHDGGRRRVIPPSSPSSTSPGAQPPAGVIIDYKMQMVLWVAGLRGAMSFALVENIPLYDTVTKEGSKVKPELKAMTSATIVFTVFVLGGYTYYLMEMLGMTPNQQAAAAAASETKPLVKRSSEPEMAVSTVNLDEGNDRSRVRHRQKDKLVAY